MVNVIFCGFEGAESGKRIFAKPGDVLLRVAETNGIKIPTQCKDGTCGSCAVVIEDLSTDVVLDPLAEEYATSAKAVHMEEKELNTLIEMGAITRKEAEVAEAYHRATPVRLACQCIIKNEILVKPFE